MGHRISLAFTLTLNKMLNKPFLILDEVGPALDQNAKEAMIETLREYGPPTVIVTEHGGMHGVFDHIIDMGEIRPVL
jgi:DNA repair exonuclease SbcCD ATPase subunit